MSTVSLKQRGNYIDRADWPPDLVAVDSFLVLKKEEHDPEEKPERLHKSWFDCSHLHFSKQSWSSLCQERQKVLTSESKFDVNYIFDDTMPRFIWLH